MNLIEATDAIAQDLGYMAQQVLNARLGRSNQISIRTNTNVERIGDGEIVLQSGGSNETLSGIDQVVFAIERTMDKSLDEALVENNVAETVKEYFVIGDCVWPREPYDNVMEGYQVARLI